MINIWVILFIFIFHWFADFVVQTEWQARNKSTNAEALIGHVFVYSVLWILPIFIYGCVVNLSGIIMLFPLITFICHWITDYYTSRTNSILAKEARETDNFHDFFIGVGFDQLLHYIQLFLTFYLLTK